MRARAFRWLRDWWPTLAIVALALFSIPLLHSSLQRWHATLEEAVSAVDHVGQSRRRLTTAYMVELRRAAGDSAFATSSALAEVAAARDELHNWSRGRESIAGFRTDAPDDPRLVALAHAYSQALGDFGTELSRQPRDRLQLRRQFSQANAAASELDAAVHEWLRARVREEERSGSIRVAGWTFLLIVAGLGVTAAARARRHAERKHASSESRLSRLRAVAPIGIVECDVEGRIQAANTMWCRFSGEAESAWEGRVWWEALNERDMPRARELWDASISSTDQHTAELRFRSESRGEPVWVLARTAHAVYAPRDLERTDSGVPAPQAVRASRWVVTFTDISQRRLVEAQLQQAQKMEAIGRLAGGVAHDFNNLLTSIGGFANLARSDLPPGSPLEADLAEIERAAERGRGLTRQMLTFSRQERIEPELLDVRHVVAQLQRMLERLVRADVELVIRLDDQRTVVMADRGQLEQVVTNLVVNAADALEGSGRIRIGVANTNVQAAFEGTRSEVGPGRYVLLSVSDNGSGIPQSVRERIFEPFFTTKPAGKGTGLGLSTVWGIVRQGGGHVHLYTEEGRGTVFKIYLPASASSDQSVDMAALKSAPAAERVSGTVLLVEDEEAVRRLATRVLQLNGWTTLEAPDGARALEIIEAHSDSIDLLITDVVMRGMGGIELTERLRDQGHRIPTLFVSGYSESDLPLEHASFLEKPFSPDSLVRAVNKLVRG